MRVTTMALPMASLAYCTYSGIQTATQVKAFQLTLAVTLAPTLSTQ